MISEEQQLIPHDLLLFCYVFQMSKDFLLYLEFTLTNLIRITTNLLLFFKINKLKYANFLSLS